MPEPRREPAIPRPAVVAAAGAFAARRLEEAGLGPVAEKIVRCGALDRDDVARLASAEVALLGKLVELKRRHAVPSPRESDGSGRSAVESLRDSDGTGHGVTGLLGLDVLRSVAVARLRMPDDVAIAVDATQMDPKLARLAVEFGADASACEPIEEEMTEA